MRSVLVFKVKLLKSFISINGSNEGIDLSEQPILLKVKYNLYYFCCTHLCIACYFKELVSLHWQKLFSLTEYWEI